MRRWRRTLGVIAMALAFAGAARAVPPEVIDDVVCTIKARKLLYDDELLRPLGLGVIVSNRVATLWGPIADADLGLRAESRLRSMIELRDVRNQFDLVPDAVTRRSRP